MKWYNETIYLKAYTDISYHIETQLWTNRDKDILKRLLNCHVHDILVDVREVI